MRKGLLALVTAALGVLGLGCAGRGLVTDHYEPEFYRVEKLLPDSMTQENPSFIVYGDNQGCFRVVENFAKKHNWWTWKQALIPFYQVYWLSNGVRGVVNGVRVSPDGGKRTRLMMRDAVYRAAAESNADFIVNTGDICTHDGRRPAHWRKFLMEYKVQSPLLNEIPFLPTPGNHERTSDARWGRPNYEAVFDYPPFYEVEFKNAALFMIDSEIICDLYGDMDDAEQDRLFEQWFVSPDSTMPAWLESSLKNCTKKYKIVVMHIPPISFGRHFYDWTRENRYGNAIPEKRKALLELFYCSGVQVVFSGHEHLYQHNVLHFGDADLHVVVSSGGGVPLRHLPDEERMSEQRQYYADNHYDVETLKIEKVFHYCEVSVSDTSLTIRTVEVDRKSGEPAGVIETIQL